MHLLDPQGFANVINNSQIPTQTGIQCGKPVISMATPFRYLSKAVFDCSKLEGIHEMNVTSTNWQRGQSSAVHDAHVLRGIHYICESLWILHGDVPLQAQLTESVLAVQRRCWAAAATSGPARPPDSGDCICKTHTTAQTIKIIEVIQTSIVVRVLKPHSLRAQERERKSLLAAQATAAKQASDRQRRTGSPPMASTPRPEQRPLLPSNHSSHHEPERGDTSEAHTLKHRTARWLNSKAGHYSILALVSLDIAGIFTAFILQLFACEGHISRESSARAEHALEILSLVFSCLFVLELGASVWVFGWAYFRSKFHCFDAAVILIGFVIDVLLKGVLEEIGSLVVIMRLWRVFKIIEELSAGAEEQMENLQRQIVTLQRENEALSDEVRQLKRK